MSWLANNLWAYWLTIGIGWIILFAIAETYAIAKREETLSAFVWGVSTAFPPIIFLAGMVIGGLCVHFWWHWCPAGSFSTGAIFDLLVSPAHAETIVASSGADAQPLVQLIYSYLGPVAIALLLWFVRQAVAAWDRFVNRHAVLAKLSIDAAHNAVIVAAVSRQASSLVADGKVVVSGLTIRAEPVALDAAVHAAEIAAPDALAYFRITPDEVAKRIVDALPHVQAVAQLQAQSGGVPAAVVTSTAK